MTEIFDKLRDLQDILAEKYEIQRDIEEAPKKLFSQDELLARLKKEFIEKNADYENVRKKVVMLKTELAEAEAAREKGEKDMDNITTHREYEVLDKEIRDAAEAEQNTRKELQKQEKILADINDALKNDEKMIASQEEDLKAGKASLDKEIAAMHKKLDKLIKKEEKIVPGVDPEIIFKFERIIKSKETGIVAVKGNVCEGCHMILPAQFANKVRNGDDINFCPYCSRILYYQEAEDGENEYFHLDDTGSLTDFEDDSDMGDSTADRETLKELGYDE
ncbi:C4-type zinc ribbon domain-containing protein [Treponema sp. HNW]|uniref:zinc ribbon domain-containing protein n=1 Tax=Treponema sp. HNW TaxID=3116654 RepID=UPI003D13C942